MAKIKQCKFCGKELKSRLFHSEVYSLSAGGLYLIDCCDECYKRETAFLESLAHKERVERKLGNLKIGLYKDDQIPELLKRYKEESDAYEKKRGKMLPTKHSRLGSRGFCEYDEYGHFWVREAKKIKSRRDLIKEVEQPVVYPCAFDKSDISMLQYTIDWRWSSDQVYRVLIRLNHENEFTYKPCIVENLIVMGGLFKKKKVKKIMIELFDEFKEMTGVDLPVEYVSYWSF